MQRAVDARRELVFEMRRDGGAATAGRGGGSTTRPVCSRRDRGDRARRVDVERQRAEVVDDDEVGAVERGAQRAGIDVAVGSVASIASPGSTTSSGSAVVLDRARDAPRLEAELVQRPGPLAGLDRHAVVAAEPERDGDRLRRHGADVRANYGAATYARRRLVASSTARATASASCCGRTIAEPETSCSAGGITNTTVTTATSWRADPHDLRVVDVDAFGRGLELAQRVDGGQRDEPVAGGRRDRTFREPDGFVVVERERDAYQRTQPARLGGDRDDRRPGLGGGALVEDAAAELHDRDDPAVELEPERRERDRLHVAHDLLRVLALVGDDVDFGDATVGFGDDANDRDVGQPTDLPFDFREVQFVHALVLPTRPRATTIGRGERSRRDHPRTRLMSGES